METVEKFKNLKADFEKKMKEMFAELKEEFGRASRELFDKYPLLESFGIPCFTDHWNDGEPCNWHSHNDAEMLSVNGIQGSYADDHEDEEDEKWMFTKKRYGKTEYSAPGQVYDDCVDFFAKFPTDFFKNVFDEGLITIYRNGTVKVLHYDHE